MIARDDILKRVRTRLARDPAQEDARRREIREMLAAPAERPRPVVPAHLLAHFVAMAELSSSTVERVTKMSEAPAAALRYLQVHGLPTQAVCAGDVAELPWESAGLAIAVREARDEDLVGITGCFCAIAETGTLMMLSGPGSPAAVSLLPETHIAVVPAARIVPGMEEAWRLLRAERGELPRAVNFISGPSRTGDIEQTIVLGAHGPYRVHLVIVEA